MGGDAVGAGDSWRGGRSGTHWKDRGKGEGCGRGRQEKRQGHQLSGPLWGQSRNHCQANGKRGGEEGTAGGAMGCASSWRLGTGPLLGSLGPSGEGLHGL